MDCQTDPRSILKRLCVEVEFGQLGLHQAVSNSQSFLDLFALKVAISYGPRGIWSSREKPNCTQTFFVFIFSDNMYQKINK